MTRRARKGNFDPAQFGDDPVDGRRLIAENLRLLRQRVGLSQEALADRARIHRTYVGSVERGERNISVDLICRLASALKVHPKELLTSMVEGGVESLDSAGTPATTKVARRLPTGRRREVG